MFKRFVQFLRLPTFEDTEQNLRANNLNTILLTTMVLTLLYLLYTIVVPPHHLAVVAIIVLLIEVGLLTLLRIRKTQLAAILLVGMLWLALTYIETQYGGIRDTGFSMFSALILIAGLTLGVGGGIVTTILVMLTSLAMLYAEKALLLPPRPLIDDASVLLSHTILFLTNFSLLYLAVQSIRRIAQRSAESEKAIRAVNLQLEQSQSELRKQTEILATQNRILNIVAELASKTTSLQDEEKLLSETLNILQRHLPTERISIYLVNESMQFLLLALSTHETSTQLKTVPIFAQHGPFLTEAGTLLVQVGDITYSIPYPSDPFLEPIFPLKTPRHFLGVLHVRFQSEPPSESVNIALQTFADQIAIGLENLRLSTQLQARLQEIDFLTGQKTQSAWQEFTRGKPFGYQYDRLKLLPSSETYPPEVMQQLQEGRPAMYITKDKKPTARLVAPLRLAGQTIGVVGYEEDPNTVWEQEQITMLEAIANQISLRLENTRLILEARERAEQEQTLSRIAARIRETLDIETILQTAIAEIQSSYDLAEAEVHLQTFRETE
ncbi:MAG: hypothetical protein NZL98_09990 [Anaerolineales bacterium]|nr:hypothetical protein [Anaerolineales bacterium]